MKKNWKSIPACLFTAAGLVAMLGAPLMAQQNTVEKSKSTNSSSKTSKPGSAAGPSDQASADTLFMKRALAVGIAEIEFSQVALQNSSSEKVKDFAQKMIEDHTTANNKLSTILNGTPEESVTASNPITDANSSSGTGTGTGTGTGSGTSVDSVGTSMGTSMSSDSSGAVNGMGTMSDSIGTRSGIGTDSNTTTTAASAAVQEKPKPATALKLSGSYLDMKNKMEQLSGPAFDKQYVEQSVKDHNLSIKLLEKYQQEGKNSQIKAWVNEQLPIIRHHKAAAAKLTGTATTAKKSTKS